MNIIINGKEPRDEKRQVVFFTLSKNGSGYKFSHGSVPTALDTDTKIKNWLKKQDEQLLELIENKIANGTYENKHPYGIELEAEINASSISSPLKEILIKIARRIS